MKIKFITQIAIIGLLVIIPFFDTNAKNNIIWYQKPATKWMEAIPEGNGRLSTMIYGGIYRETIALNEISMWSGQPDSTSNDLCGKEQLTEMRKYFFENNPEKGNELGNKYLNGRMTTFGTHVPLGNVEMDFTYPNEIIREYKRSLDLNDAVTTVTFKCGDIAYKREYIVNYPDNVIAMKFTADKGGSISTKISLNLLRQAEIKANREELTLNGKVNFPMHGHGGVQFYGILRIMPEGGSVAYDSETISVTDANSLTLLIDVRTDYNNIDYKMLCAETINKAESKGFEILKQNHRSDYSQLFKRMSLVLGNNQAEELPTDVQLSLAKSGVVNPNFDALFFQYGRYMLISSSREHDLPLCANLQGIWNDNMACNMPWTCDYHLDINIEQNYWAANRANLSECNIPLFKFLKLLSENGANTARKMYGCRGWVAHTVCNAWGYTASGWGVGWGMNVSGGAWLATHLWSHYQYTLDKDYLRKIGYPILKETAQFFMDYMVKDPRTGYLVTGPSISPENGYISQSGNNLSLDMMPTIDRDIVSYIYNACVESSKILGVDKAFGKKLERDIKLLPPVKIGSDGQIQEWSNDVRRSDPAHRHSSHLLSLFPLNQISYSKDKDLMEAAEKGLKIQTGGNGWEDTEWSTANMLCFNARMKKPEAAYSWLQNLFGRFTRENLMTVSPTGVAGAENDIFSFDATEASVAGMCEMLMQSYDGHLDFLPALPEAWNTGEIHGLCAKGGLVIDMKWKDRKMQWASIKSTTDCEFRINGIKEIIKMKKDEMKKVTF